MIARVTFACLALLAAAAFGVARAQAPAEAPPRYEVEIVVFAHTDFDPSEEHFTLEQTAQPFGEPETLRPSLRPEDLQFEPLEPAEPPLQPSGGAAGLPPDGVTPGDPTVVDSGASPPEPGTDLTSVLDYRTGRRSLRFRPLRPEELKLGNERQTLERLSAYRPLLHVGWVQEVLSEGDAQPFDLALIGTLSPAGSVRVHLSRFLHVTLDLRYQPAGSIATTSPGVFGLDEVPLAPRYQLRTERRIRSNDVNYFDHPAFGVLIVVRPAPEAPTETPAARPAA